MNQGPTQAVDLSKLPPPNAESSAPAPQTVKEAATALESVSHAYRWRATNAQHQLEQAEKQYVRAVQQARNQRTLATTPKKIGSLGVLQRVSLTETTIKTPKGEFALTPEVQARAEQHGNKQVVQGWVFKSDNDRREVYLHIDGPDWGVVLPFSMKHSTTQPRELHAFATKINVAARNVDRAKAAIAERTQAAERQLATAIADRGAVDAAADALVNAASATDELISAANAAERILEASGASDRKARKLREAVDAAREHAVSRPASATARRDAVRTATASAQSEAARHRPAAAFAAEHKPRSAGAAATSSAEPVPPGPLAPAFEESDIFEQIRKLGELRDAGLLTDDEFQAKKNELLGRL